MAVRNEEKLGLPLVGMLFMGAVGMVVSALSFIVIRYWPVPVSVAPYFGGRVGLVWGLVCGAVFGLILGYCVDDSHFDNPQA